MKIFFISFLMFTCFIGVVSFFLTRFLIPAREPVFGVTFSQVQAEEFDLQWRDAYIAILTELGVKKVRIPIYWNRVEIEPGVYDFSDVDWMMDLAAEQGVDVTLVTGMKVPRWPECFAPIWSDVYTQEEYRRDILKLVLVTVERYRNHPALERWQVENEPFFPFGDCPASDADRYFAELRLVRSLDSTHPIQRTTSGEQSIWLTSTVGSDIVGASLYRIVYNKFFGYLIFPLPPSFYRVQAILAGVFVDRVIISELQAEPWFGDFLPRLSIDEKYDLFTVRELDQHVRFVKMTGVDEVYLWGVEWWYYLHMNGRSELWNFGKTIFE